MLHKSKHGMHESEKKGKMGERRHGENITTANGLFEGFEKSVTNLERKISVKIFKQNYGMLICKYSAFENVEKSSEDSFIDEYTRRDRT